MKQRDCQFLLLFTILTKQITKQNKEQLHFFKMNSSNKMAF